MEVGKTDVDVYLEYLAQYARCIDNSMDVRKDSASQVLRAIWDKALGESGHVDFKRHCLVRENVNIVSPTMIDLLVYLAGFEDAEISGKSKQMLLDILLGHFNGEIMYGLDMKSPWQPGQVVKDGAFQKALVCVQDELPRPLKADAKLLALLFSLPDIPKSFREKCAEIIITEHGLPLPKKFIGASKKMGTLAHPNLQKPIGRK